MRTGLSVCTWLLAGGMALLLPMNVGAQRGGQSSMGQTGTQQTVPQITPNASQGPLGADDAVIEHTARIERDQERARNADRQKKLVADTERLLALATELKTEVDKTNKDMLSVDVVRKADEIEKLAHSVKEKMKGT